MNPVAISRAAVAVLTAAVLFLFFRHDLFASSPAPILAQVLAAALMLWARMTFGLRSFHATADPTVGGVVEGGPYRWIRHPIYAAILLFVWAGVGSHPSVVSVAAGLIASIATAVRMRTEETLLVTRYPAYAAYAARTKRVVPFIL